MRGATEDSTTKKKTLTFYSTDGYALIVTCHQASSGKVDFTIQTEDGPMDVELSRAEATEVAEFIRRGV